MGNNDSENDIFSSEEADKLSRSSDDDADNNDDSANDKLITFIKLKDDTKTEVRYVYHISDIHIRNTQRHIEYKEVFERTYQKLKNQIGSNKKISLIVLTGDIMHTKTEMSPESFSIAQDFFKALNEIAPVVLIPGNHDCNLSNKDRMDALSPIVAGNVKFDDLFYLKQSGIYQYHNIIFGVTSIFDDVLINAAEIKNDIWQTIKQKNKYKIALYHGPVHGAKTDVGYRMNIEQLLAEDFDGYDYVMLGDIHKYQYMNDKETIAYAGSLIQQSYGESLNNHGILKWDLLDGESEMIEIKNDYGYCTIKIVNGKFVDTPIPRKPRIRFVLENTNQLQYQDVLKSLEKEYQICEIVKESNFQTKLQHANSSSRKKIKEEASAYVTQESIIKSYLTKKGLEKDKITLLLKLHKKIYQKIFSDKKDQVADSMHNATRTQKWKLLELKFTNTLSYGYGVENVIDFTRYDPNKIIGIVAPNHYGKSAVLDIILFCLFDKCSRGDRKDILNKNEKMMRCSVLLSVGSQKYLIERIGHRSKNGLTVKIDVNFYSIKKNVKENFNGIDKNDTNKKIVDLIGDYKDYLTTCFCLQQESSYNFIDMTQSQKKAYLNEILKLNVFEDCYNMAWDKLKKLTGQLKLLEQKVGTKSLEEIKKNIKITSAEIKKLELQKNNINLTLAEELEYILGSLTQNSLTKYNELSDYNLTTEENILKNISDIKNKLNQKNDINLEKIRKELEETKLKVTELEAELDRINSTNDMENMIAAKELLIKKLVNLPKTYDADAPKKIYKEINEITNKINTIDAQLDITFKRNNQTQNINDETNRIAELKVIIDTLRKSLKPINENCEQTLLNLKAKLSANEKNIVLLLDKTFGTKENLSPEEKINLKKKLSTIQSFAEHLGKNLSQLDSYQKGISENNDDVINNIKNNDQAWLDRFAKWSEQVNEQLNKNDEGTPDVGLLIKESRKLTNQIMLTSIDVFDIHNNNIIMDEIRTAEKELDSIVGFNNIKKEIDYSKKEKKLLQEKIAILDNSIKEIEFHKKHMDSNALVQKEIDDLQILMDNHNVHIKKLTKCIKEFKNIIFLNENIITEHKKQIKENDKITLHLKLLEEYRMLYLNWCQKNDYYKKWLKIKKEFDNDLNIMTKEIEKKQMELAMYKKDIEQYLQYRKEFDEKSIETNMYQLYVQSMNYNGLPYEILKTYLPLIEADINQILHSMVNFNIEFMYYDENKLEEQKTKQLKSNMGCVDINICYQNMNPYNVQLASGFERFIIGLAIRMTLCQISLTAKPNFLIIDEGWGCLDSENLGNVATIMNYIKLQYEHIIIISHLEELKNQADYVINIEKKNGYSYIKTEQKLINKRKKRHIKKKVIEV
jgi:DNA repair exonuclease SbcCD ATPase subunit/predicted phosphodiesterase